jgi:hypothetical protein
MNSLDLLIKKIITLNKTEYSKIAEALNCV